MNEEQSAAAQATSEPADPAIDALRREVSRLNERLDEASAAPGNPADERPPHY